MKDTIKNSSGETLDYSFAKGASVSKKQDWLYIIGHGVTGDKDRPIVTDSAKALNETGFDTLAFSFAGNGNSQGDFRAATITNEIGDLTAVLDAVSKTYPKIAYIGHSMGAAVGVLVASRDPRIQRLVSLAGMVDTEAFAQTEFGSEVPDSGLMWEEESCPLSQAFMTDLCKTIGSVLESAKKISVPWLLIHGSEDDVVLMRDSQSIADLGKENTTFEQIEGGDHSFNEAARAPAMTALASWAAG